MKEIPYPYRLEDACPSYKSSNRRSEQELKDFLDYIITHSEEGIRKVKKIDETLERVSKSLEDSIKKLKKIEE